MAITLRWVIPATRPGVPGPAPEPGPPERGPPEPDPPEPGVLERGAPRATDARMT